MLESSDSLIKNIVLLLGNFHTTYNLLGCIGKLMAGNGLSDVLCEVYGESTVSQMLSGKACSRAAAAGHYNYSESAYMYLQSMINLESSNQKVYTHFKNGHFVVRRSSRFWAGL